MDHAEDEEKEIECVNCGGTDFTKEGGFYFCSECQTQSQDVREQVFEQTENCANVHEKRIALRKNKTPNGNKKLTSWETYNYILYGLVQEFENLGADEDFTKIMYHLWMEYLTRLECISENQKPAKLGCSFNRRDAEIVYQRKYKRKRNKSSTDGTISVKDMDERMKIKERSKKRKMMERAEYDTQSVTSSTTATSLATQTLSSLSTDDESVAGHIHITESFKKQLLQHMSYKHLQKHLADTKSQMKCHLKYRKLMSEDYTTGPKVLTKNKLYCVLYLGMIMAQQEFQISDIIRFCREGHISFLLFQHFFPDTIDDDLIDHSVYSGGKKEFPSYDFIRHFTFDLYKYLQLRPCDFSPNMVKLCRRYCTELNLPDHIFNIASFFIEKSRPFHLSKFKKRIPNYEGRCMGFIIYVLKVLFGFDDYTEHELSKFAKLVNNNPERPKKQPKLFNFEDWFDYIEYRKMVLKYVHFPTWYILEPDNECPLDLYVKMLMHKHSMFDIEENRNLRMNVTKKILGDIEEFDSDKLINFEPSLTPFRSYIDKLLQMDNFTVKDVKINKKVLKDASKYSIDHLIYPNDYLKQIESENCKFIYSNAHPDHKIKIDPVQMTRTIKNNFQIFEQNWNKTFLDIKKNQIGLTLLTNKILQRHVENKPTEKQINVGKIIAIPQSPQISIKDRVYRNSKGLFCKIGTPGAVPIDEYPTRVRHKKWRMATWYNTELPLVYNQSTLDEKEIQNTLNNFVETKNLNENNEYNYHYIPRMEYIMNGKPFFHESNKKYEIFEKNLPKNFRWLLEECARVLEQPTKMLYEEFSRVEIYMNYIYYHNNPVDCPPFDNDIKIKQMITRVQKVW